MSRISFIAAVLLLGQTLMAAPRPADFKVLCDSLSARAQRRMGVRSEVALKQVLSRGKTLDLYFTRNLSDYPWHASDCKWFRNEIKKEWKDYASGYEFGEIFCQGVPFEELATPVPGNNGRCSSSYRFRKDKSARSSQPLVTKAGSVTLKRGLGGRHIAVWQSHGLYWNESQQCWRYQRAPVHRTVEDMYTQSYVIPFLIPMLENAGACVLTPRERDVQRHEVVCDNDPSFALEREGTLRRNGRYSEKGTWGNAGAGFSDSREVYSVTDNPFTTGTARKAMCGSGASVRWSADIPERGSYAVYVSYKTLPDSNPAARYSVRHAGGLSRFTVNQTMCGGTWVYLGTFEFIPGQEAYVELDSAGPSGREVTADAVRFGGGMGKVARDGVLSGEPAYMEGAYYSLVWGGATEGICENGDTDYKTDYKIRGKWVDALKNRRGVPVDCSLAFHTDAGTTPNDSIVGTLSIYTLKSDGSRKFDDGTDRMCCRCFADYVQSQVVSDIRTEFEPKWSRRQLWDRSYAESRTPGVPSMLLELLSHQNFADMRYGLDPSFRFTVSRAVYKGILKFLSELYGVPYTVQPLPVRNFSVVPEGGSFRLRWSPSTDPLEPTAEAESYILYTRKGDGAFDQGIPVADSTYLFSPEPGELYSFKIAACNQGGVSFPSETLSAGIGGDKGNILIVNDFYRIGAPASFDTPDYAGFDARRDSGVPYINDISYIGENYENHRGIEWKSDYDPGFGASFCDRAGEVIAGNTLDYPSVHGRELMALGYSFCSMSRSAFCTSGSIPEAVALDLICGKQGSTVIGSGRVPQRFQVFPDALSAALADWTSTGRGVLISGCSIASDPAVPSCLGYSCATAVASGSGNLGGYRFYREPCGDCYSVESPDGIQPSDSRGRVWLRYKGSNAPGAVKVDAGGYRVVAIGVPVECFCSESDRRAVLSGALEYILE